MADVNQPTTGFVNNGSLVQFGSDNTADQWDYITLSAPKKTWRIVIDGDIPTGTKEPEMSVSFYEGNLPLFSAVGTWEVQGHSSAGAAKKNWKLKLVNSKTGNTIQLKIGDWLPISEIVLKAYATDRTLVRDIVTTELWRYFHKDSSGLLAPLSAYAYFDQSDCGTHMASLFSTDGFPCELYNQQGLIGLYVLRTGIEATSYLMDVNNSQHILMEAHLTNNFWVDGKFLPEKWDFSSPQTVTDPVHQACQRLVSWGSDCLSGKVDIRATYKNYIDLDSWIDYMLLCETAVSPDSILNNFLLGSWNATATQGIWRIYPYDEDQTFGLIGGNYTVEQSAPETIGWITKVDQVVGGQTPTFFEYLHQHFKPEIRARWRYLRDHKYIDSDSINQMIKDKVSLINPDMMAKDLQLWSVNAETGLGSGTAISDHGKKWSVSYIMDYAKRRIEWLDQQFKYYS